MTRRIIRKTRKAWWKVTDVIDSYRRRNHPPGNYPPDAMWTY